MTWEYNVKADMCTAKGDARGRYTPYSIRRLVIATTVAGTTGEQPWECRGLTSLLPRRHLGRRMGLERQVNYRAAAHGRL